MPATHAKFDRNADPAEQLRQLREQVEILMRERAAPLLADTIDRVEGTVRQVAGKAQEQSDALAKRVRDQPLSSVLIAAAAGYLIGRVTR